jgi:hypothetical protein
MKIASKYLPNLPNLKIDQSGLALMQVMAMAAFLALLSVAITQIMTNATRNNQKMINRNQSLTFSILLSDQVSNKVLLKNLETIPTDISGVLIQYQ